MGTKPKIHLAGRMRDGDAFRFRVSTVDRYETHELAGIAVDSECLSCDNRWYTNQQPKASRLRGEVWVPSWMDPEQHGERIDALKTGGRTFLLDGLFAKPLTLDLSYHGWSKTRVLQEVIPEVKGAGTDLRQTSVQPALLRNDMDPAIQELVRRYDADQPLIGFTREAHLDTPNDLRPKGGQRLAYAEHAFSVTATERRSHPVKFAPVIYVHALPDELLARIERLDASLPEKTVRCEDTDLAQEIRLTPSTVRAVYFDKSTHDGQLIDLARRVGEDPSAIASAGEFLARDASAYLDTIARYTIHDGESYLWSKVGDAHLAWCKSNRDIWDEAEVQRYRFDHPMAWYIAKDMTIAPTGAWFVDLESFTGGWTREGSHTRDDLVRKQGIYVLCVLRDFQRVTTQVRIASELTTGKTVSTAERRKIQEGAIDDIIAACNDTRYICASRVGDDIRVRVQYAHLSDPLDVTVTSGELSRRF